MLQSQYGTAVERNDFGYTFGYRYQLGQIMLNWAKFRFCKGLDQGASSKKSLRPLREG
jgi:hypothetical protein